MRPVMLDFSEMVKRFWRAETGAAAVEFALTMPLLMVLYFGSMEASRAIAYDRRLTAAASSLGDLVAQKRGDLTEAELQDLFAAAKITVAPYDASDLKQVVTCVYVDADGNATVEWSRGTNGGDPHEEDDAYDLPGEFTAMASETYVIVSEAEMAYQSLTSLVLPDTLDLYKEHFYVPRYGEFIDII